MNKILILGVVFILLFTVNLSLNNSHASLVPIYQLPIVLTNTQNISTPDPFQQLININIQTINQDLSASNISASLIYDGPTAFSNGFEYYKNYNFSNFDFSYSNGQIIPAWIESGPNPYGQGDLLVWLKLRPIGAKSSITIYLDVFSKNDNLLSGSGTFGIGENPLYSPVYGEYDDGASVFDFYDNFAGKTLNGNNWAYGGSGEIIVDKGGYLKSNNYIYIITKNGFNPLNTVCDIYVSQQTIASTTNIAFSMTTGNLNNSNGYFWLSNSFSKFSNGSYSKQGSILGNSNYNGFINSNVESESWRSNNYQVYIRDYGYSSQYYNNTSFKSYLLPLKVFYGIGIQYQGSAFINVSWFRVRAYPPNGVMPSVSLGGVLNVNVSNISNSNQQNNLINNNSSFNISSGNLYFNSQYFSFIISSMFIYYLLIFLILIFVLFMAVVVVRGHKNG